MAIPMALPPGYRALPQALLPGRLRGLARLYVPAGNVPYTWIVLAMAAAKTQQHSSVLAKNATHDIHYVRRAATFLGSVAKMHTYPRVHGGIEVSARFTASQIQDGLDILRGNSDV